MHLVLAAPRLAGNALLCLAGNALPRLTDDALYCPTGEALFVGSDRPSLQS